MESNDLKIARGAHFDGDAAVDESRHQFRTPAQG